jgi:UDP-N-acetylmuramate dehydrogenase
MIDEKTKQALNKLVENPVQWDCSLANYTSFGIGGVADALVTVESKTELEAIVDCLVSNKLEYCFIGRGTNILVSDDGFRGAVLLFGKLFSKIVLLEEAAGGAVRVRVDGGCSLAKLLGWCMDNSYSGLEFASGIPGSVGGAVAMNAGAWAGEMADIIDSVTVYSNTNKEELLERKQLEFEYRKWKNQQNGQNEERVVLSADIVLNKGNEENIRATCAEYREKRKDKQPKGVRNAGSFFKNPVGETAGRLIDAAGLKGLRCGDAMVSPVHANFLVNTGEATAKDVKELMALVMEKVRSNSGIELKPEVHFL